jgi:acylphosphatase
MDIANELVAVKLVLRGRVQGVGFRAYLELHARRLGIKGYAKNLFSGDVEVYAEGPRARIEGFIELARKGPHLARVDHMDVQWLRPEGKYVDFYVY